MGSAKRRIPHVRYLRGAAHGSARTGAGVIFTTTDRMAAHRKLGRHRVYLCAGGLRKRASQSKRQIRLSRKDHQIVKTTKEVSMQYLIPFAVVSVMVLYVLIIASCLCYIGRHGHRTS